MSAPPHRFLAILLALLLWGGQVSAHELRPGYLDIKEQHNGRYDVLFKVPARGNLRLHLYVHLPESCTNLVPPHTEKEGLAFVDRFAVTCGGGLAGKRVTVDGLTGTFTDVIARVALAGGSVQAARMTPDQPQFIVTGSPTWAGTARTYFFLGVQHILLGIDHLSFVLALLLLVQNRWMLMKTITAFTCAHSLTLAAAALGWAHVSQAPIEAMIALSITFAAAAIPGGEGRPADMIRRAPWVAAFAFGLLHGFGFGGALREIGLPQLDVPLALLTFNLGVEAGQLLFVFAVFLLIAAARTVPAVNSLNIRTVRTAVAYGIGSFAAVLFVERLAVIF